MSDVLAPKPHDLTNQQLPHVEGLLPEHATTSQQLLVADTVLSQEVSIEQSLPWRQGEDGVNLLDGAKLATTIPTEAYKIDKAGKVYIPATSLDALDEGEYSIELPGSEETIRVIEIDGAKFVKASSSRNDRHEKYLSNFEEAEEKIPVRLMPPGFPSRQLTEGMALELSEGDDEDSVSIRLAQEFGYRFDSNTYGRTIPTPATLQTLIEKNQLPIEFTDEATEFGAIPIRNYLEAFARGKYPVGTNDIGVYSHDVRMGDHIGGVLALGEEGMAMLAPIAQAALEKFDNLSQTEKGEVLNFFDDITSRLATSLDNIQPSETSWIGNIEVASDIARMSRQISDMGEMLSVEIKAEKVLAFFQRRFSELDQRLQFGEGFEDFLDALNHSEIPEPRPKWNPYQDNPFAVG